MVLTTLLNRPISFGGSKSHMHMVGYKRWTTVGMLDSIVAKVNWIYIYIYDMAIWLWPRIGRDSPIFSHVFPPTNGLGAEKAKVRGQSLPGPRSVSPKGLRIHRFSSTFDDPRVRSEGR